MSTTPLSVLDPAGSPTIDDTYAKMGANIEVRAACFLETNDEQTLSTTCLPACLPATTRRQETYNNYAFVLWLLCSQCLTTGFSQGAWQALDAVREDHLRAFG
jgi:hypothetical protein